MGAIKVIDQLIMQYNVSSDEHFTVNNNNDDVPLHMNIEGTQDHFTLNNINDAANDSELVDDALVGSESVFDDKLDEEVTDANAILSRTVPIEDERTATKMKQILDILKMKTKYDSCKACLPCLPEMGNLEDAKLSCVNGECYRCGFDKLWSKGVRRVIILKDFDNQQKEWVESLNKDSVFATDAWLEIIDWCSYTTKEGPTVAEHLRELSQQVRPPGLDDGDYLPASETKTARNLVLETNRGTIIDYLDHFEKMISSHILHRNLVSLEHRSKKEYERNLRLWTIQHDIDFSENGSIENFDKVRSEHW